MGLVGTGAYEDDDQVGIADAGFCFFFPILFRGGFYERAVDDFEGADRVFGLADQEVFEGFVFVEIEADEYFFHGSGECLRGLSVFGALLCDLQDSIDQLFGPGFGIAQLFVQFKLFPVIKIIIVFPDHFQPEFFGCIPGGAYRYEEGLV